MTSFCMFREDEYAPIYESVYDFSTGTIQNVPISKFLCHLPDYFSTEFDVPVNYGMRFDRAFYVLALQLTRGLAAFNFYDVGVTVLSREGVFVLLKEGTNLKYFDDTQKYVTDVFSYKKNYIGTYKTLVTQFDVPMAHSLLVADDEGNILTNKGVIKYGVTSGVDKMELFNLNCIKVWRNGLDGVILTDTGDFVPYKISYPTIEIQK